MPLPVKAEMIEFLRLATSELREIADLLGRDVGSKGSDVYAIAGNAQALLKDVETDGVDSTIMQRLSYLAEDVDQVAVGVSHSAWQRRIMAISATAMQAVHEAGL